MKYKRNKTGTIKKIGLQKEIAQGRIYIGIDPGANGALVTLDSNDRIDVLKFQGPIISNVFIEKLCVKYGADNLIAALEKVGTMPTDGRVSAHKFGINIGEWQGMLIAHHIKFLKPPPQKWQAGLSLPPKKTFKTQTLWKKAIAIKATEIFPQAQGFIWGPRGGVNDGIADALLMAWWLKKQNT